MSVCYLFQARAALESALRGLNLPAEAAPERLLPEIKLRPPRNPGWGDLSTNAVMLLKNSKYTSMEQAAEKIMAAFRALPGVASVSLADNGYINLRYEAAFWAGHAPLVLAEKMHFGLEGIEDQGAILLKRPAEVNDLASARAEASADVLMDLAVLAGQETREEREAARPAEGFPLAGAIAKCGKEKTRFALLANPPGFIKAFSPILAIDRTYDNPVFCIPYAKARIGWLRARGMPETEAAEVAAAGTALTLPEEILLARKMCDWPLALEEALQKGDVFYLTSFLHALSLLFFALAENLRPVSSNYLVEAGAGRSRMDLLGAVETLLGGGLELLQIHNLKEYE